MKKSAGESTSDRKHVNAELSAVVKYLDKLNDMCVAKAVSYGRVRRGVRLRLHDSMRLCPYCLRVHCCNSPDARFEAMKAVIKDEAAKVASANAASVSENRPVQRNSHR